MPPLKPVPSLRTLTKDKVMYNICAVILDEIFFGQDETWEAYGPPVLSVRLDMVRDILAASLTPSLREDLLNTILARDESVEATVRYLALQLLLVQGVRSLAVGSFPESYYNLVLEATAKCGYELHYLDLRGLWVRDEHKVALMKLLRKLSIIRRLTLRYNCDDEMLAALGKYCYALQRLDVAGSRAISKEGLANLCANPRRVATGSLADTLKIVDLGGPGSQGLSPDVASYLLLTLPHLISLGSYERTGAALELAAERSPGKQFGLLYLHDNNTSHKRFLVMARTCPGLQAIYLDSPKGIALHHFDMLPQLKEIKFNKVRWNDVLIMLEKIGSQIRNLFMLSVFGEVELLEFGRLCPRLERLELHSVGLVCSLTEHPTALDSVRELFIYNSALSSLCVKVLLNQCLGLEHICLGDCNQLTDESFGAALVPHALQQVREVWLGVAQQLTVASVEALVDHCPYLTSLGNLAAWDVHPEALDLLRIQLLLTNTQLTLHEYGPNQDDWVLVEEP